MSKIHSKSFVAIALLLATFTNFIAFAQPTITSFAPTSGNVGTSVIVTGANFSTAAANNTVFFGATQALVTTASATQLTVTVPMGATYAPIVVLNTATGLLAYSTTNFTPTFTPNKGSITSLDFDPKVNLTGGSAPFFISLGDLDGDGKADIAVANSGSNTVSVFRNTSSSGTVSFDTKVDFTTGAFPNSISLGDVDGDGKTDMAVTNYSGNTVSVFRNTSSSGSITASSFSTKVDFTTGGTLPFSVSLGDLDGDGKADMVVSNSSALTSNTVAVFRNTSTKGSITASSFAAKVDFATGSYARSVSLGDLDGDGKLDMAIVNFGGNTVSVLRNTSSVGSITASSFAAKVDFATGLGPIAVSIGDLDGDGKKDIAVANYNINSVSVLRNTGSSGSITASSFATKVDFTVGTFSYSVSLGDLDGDGKADMAVANYGSGNISILRNTSTSGSITASSFATKVDLTAGTNAISVSIGDLDGDGKPDLAVANGGSDNVSVIRNNPIFPLTITSFTPTSAGQGATVTITGTNFTGVTSVSFGGMAASSFSVVSATSITAVVASGTSGNLVVTTPSETATQGGFTFVPAPTITSFTPTSGPLGTTVTIIGTNFSTTSTNNTVKFNGTTSVVTASTATSITTTVPVGATTGKISVTVASNTATSTNDFTVTASGGAVTINVEPLGTSIGGMITKNLVPLINTPNNNLDINTVTVTVQPPSRALASVANGFLTVDYTNSSFSGKENITIRACDNIGNCSTQQFEIQVSGDIKVYNAVSPDGKNPILHLEYIDKLSPKNQVSIYNRWGDEVFSVSDYDNKTRAFAGLTNGGNKLPVGTYYYKIALFTTGKSMTGFLQVKY
jgi:hypothetical protein